jgi:hypothetical protein
LEWNEVTASTIPIPGMLGAIADSAERTSGLAGGEHRHGAVVWRAGDGGGRGLNGVERMLSIDDELVEGVVCVVGRLIVDYYYTSGQGVVGAAPGPSRHGCMPCSKLKN